MDPWVNPFTFFTVGLLRDRHRLRAYRQELEIWVTRLGMDVVLDEPRRGESVERVVFAGRFEGVPVEVEIAGGRTEVRASVTAFMPGPVWIEPRHKASAPANSGNPVLDMLASFEQAPAALIERMGDPACAEEVMGVLHAYQDWLIAGDHALSVTIGFDKLMEEHMMEDTLRAVASLARRLAA